MREQKKATRGWMGVGAVKLITLYSKKDPIVVQPYKDWKFVGGVEEPIWVKNGKTVFVIPCRNSAAEPEDDGGLSMDGRHLTTTLQKAKEQLKEGGQMLVPVSYNGWFRKHWVTLKIDKADNGKISAQIIDSQSRFSGLGSPFLGWSIRRSVKKAFQKEDLDCKWVTNTGQQKNSFDCGGFVAYYIGQLSGDKPVKGLNAPTEKELEGMSEEGPYRENMQAIKQQSKAPLASGGVPTKYQNPAPVWTPARETKLRRVGNTPE